MTSPPSTGGCRVWWCGDGRAEKSVALPQNQSLSMVRAVLVNLSPEINGWPAAGENEQTNSQACCNRCQP